MARIREDSWEPGSLCSHWGVPTKARANRMKWQGGSREGPKVACKKVKVAAISGRADEAWMRFLSWGSASLAVRQRPEAEWVGD